MNNIIQYARRPRSFWLLAFVILLLCTLGGIATVLASPKFALLTGALILLSLLIPFLLEKLHILLFLFIGLTPLGMAIGIIEEELTIMPLLGLFIFCLWAIKLCTEKGSLIIIPEFKWLIGLATVMIVASLTGTNPWASFWVFKTYLQLFLLFFIIIQILREPKQLFLTGWILISSLSIVALLLVIDQLQFIVVQGKLASTSYQEIHARARSLRGDANYSALYFSVPIPFILYYTIIYKDIIKRAFLIGCLALLTFGIVLTYSMGGAIGLMFIAVFFVLLHENITIGKKVFLLASLVPIVLGMYTLAPASFKSRMQSQYHVIMSEDFTKWGTLRGGCWLAALNVIKQNPLVGVGMGEYPRSTGQQFYKITGIYKGDLAAHNTFLSIGAESGMMGLFIFIILIGSALKRLSGKLKRSCLTDQNLSYLGSAIYLSLASFLVQAIFLDTQSEKYLWVLLGLAATFATIVDQAKNKGMKYL